MLVVTPKHGSVYGLQADAVSRTQAPEDASTRAAWSLLLCQHLISIGIPIFHDVLHAVVTQRTASARHVKNLRCFPGKRLSIRPLT